MQSNSRGARPYPRTSPEAKPAPELGCVEPSHSTLPARLPVLLGNTECSALSKQHCFQRQFASVIFPIKGTISLALWVGCHPPTGCLPWSHLTCTPVLGAEYCHPSKVIAQPFCSVFRVGRMAARNEGAHVIGEGTFSSGET